MQMSGSSCHQVRQLSDQVKIGVKIGELPVSISVGIPEQNYDFDSFDKIHFESHAFQLSVRNVY